MSSLPLWKTCAQLGMADQTSDSARPSKPGRFALRSRPVQESFRRQAWITTRLSVSQGMWVSPVRNYNPPATDYNKRPVRYNPPSPVMILKRVSPRIALLIPSAAVVRAVSRAEVVDGMGQKHAC